MFPALAQSFFFFAISKHLKLSLSRHRKKNLIFENRIYDALNWGP
jgi:hypothetical protein